MKHLFLFFILLFANSLHSQDYMYLEKIKLKKQKDVIDNEANLIKAVDYLMSTPVDEKNSNRKACTRFIIRYAEKCSSVTVTIDGYLIDVYEGNTEILVLFMGLWVKKELAMPKQTAAFYEEYIFTEIYKYAKLGNNIVQNDMIKSLIKAGDEGAISDWLVKVKK